jgi:hypothetical protein
MYEIQMCSSVSTPPGPRRADRPSEAVAREAIDHVKRGVAVVALEHGVCGDSVVPIVVRAHKGE